MPDTPAARRWRTLVEEHRRSGLSYRAFCEAKDINPSTFGSWLSRLRKRDAARECPDEGGRPSTEPAPEPAFTTVTVAQPAGPLILALDDHPAPILVEDDTDLDLLRRVLEALA